MRDLLARRRAAVPFAAGSAPASAVRAPAKRASVAAAAAARSQYELDTLTTFLIREEMAGKADPLPVCIGPVGFVVDLL